MKLCVRLFLAIFAFCSSSQAAITISTYQNTSDSVQAGFLGSNGSALASGGISIGYFANNTAPSLAAIQGLDAGTAFSTLVSTYGFIDLRSLAGTSQQTLSGAAGPFDWSFADGVLGGNLYNISGQISATVSASGSASSSNLPVGTRLYLLGFNAGSFVGGFAGATEWAFVGESSTAGTVPSDLGSRNVRVGSMDGAEVWVGTEDGTNVRLSASAIPEPSRALLGMIGLVALFVRRRR